MMRNLITDRVMANVSRLQELSKKGWKRMTEAERQEWSGDPFATSGANLLPYGPYYSSSVELEYKNDAILATATTGGTYLYAISIVGEAAKFAGKTLTLSVDHIRTLDGGTPQIALYWHDDNGYEYAGATLTEAGTVTFTVTENTAERAYLAAYVYVTTEVEVAAGAVVRFGEVMLEQGSERHEYAPYYEVLPTQATKGAYNYSDLNRVERAVAEISEELGLNLVTKTDWGMWDIPRSADMERYLNNILVILSAISSETNIPETMSGLTPETANNIETILTEWYELCSWSPRSNDIFCGEV